MTKRPTIKDVARRAGVSFKTVSRVVNGQPGVSDDTRQRVLDAIADLDYVVNYSARSLALGGSRTLGIVIPRVHDPHAFELVYHIGELAEAQGIQVIIFTWPTFSDNLHLLYMGHGIIGAMALIAPCSVDAIEPMVQAIKIPTIVIEKPLVDDMGRDIIQSVPYVASQNREGARQGVQYLLELGHRRVAYIGGYPSTQSKLRFWGYRDALAALDIPFIEAYVRTGDWSWDSGYKAATHLWGLPSDEAGPGRPTAIFCANDSMALGAMCALQALGARVPQDVSVLGFDDIPTAAYSMPRLTTVRQPTHGMAQTALDMLLAALRGELDAMHSQLLPTELVVRDSCGHPPEA
ncbi:MAG: LacI family transcriptional regulator [Chloroflexi bacterium]|jgi:LacI family transcriptional regulator|nr:LacI family transcriptional regulator [Chloroflexota bacterium]